MSTFEKPTSIQNLKELSHNEIEEQCYKLDSLAYKGNYRAGLDQAEIQMSGCGYLYASKIKSIFKEKSEQSHFIACSGPSNTQEIL